MIKQGMSKLVVVAALVCLCGVGVKAQDLTDSTVDNSNVRTVSTSLGIPAAAPSKPAARPAFLSMGSGLDLFVGYSYLNNGYPQGSANSTCYLCYGRTNSNGYAFSATVWLNNNFGLTADFSGHNGSATTKNASFDETLDIDQDSYYFLFGPSVRHQMGKITVFAHGLVGFERADVNVTDTYACDGTCVDTYRIPMNTGFAAAIGGGADYMFSKHIGWRIIQADYLFSSMNGEYDGDLGSVGSLNNVRVSTGLIFHLGGN